MRIQLSIPILNSRSKLYEGSMFTVGRVEGNDIVIPESTVSSRHGRFVVRKDVLLFEDLNSRNGSLVERGQLRQVIAPEQPAVMEPGDRLLLGDLQNPIEICVDALEVVEQSASATVVASRSVVDNLPVLQQFKAPSHQNALFDLLRDCSDLQDPDDVFQRAAKTILDLFTQTSAVRLWMMDNEAEWREVSAYQRGDEQVLAPPSQTLLSRALDAKEVISYTPNPEEASKSVVGLRSIALVPLLTRGHSLGVIVVESPRGVYLRDTLDWLSILSTYLTATLVSAQRYRSLRKSEADLDSERENLSAEKAMSRPIVGNSPALLKVLSQLQRVARTQTSVLISGETGTGKELAARYVHAHSPRRTDAFIAVNCGAISEQLLSSELFGHVRGAFTGAESDRKGLFETADQGTIFLDEIGEISPAVQVQLLRVLQEQELNPVGSSKPIKVDVRVIAATNRDLKAEVSAGRFREDLFYRLSVFPVSLPPLRERTGDITLLADRFRESTCLRYDRWIPGFTKAALVALKQARWEGNVRQLEHEIERAVILTDDGDLIDLDALSIAETGTPQDQVMDGSVVPDDGALKTVISTFERAVIERRLERLGGNRSRTAESLEISRQALQMKLAKWKLSSSSTGDAAVRSDSDQESS